MKAEQLGLPLDLDRPPRVKSRERMTVYDAVIMLRRRGLSVCRFGRHHKINDSIADDSQLKALAAGMARHD